MSEQTNINQVEIIVTNNELIIPCDTEGVTDVAFRLFEGKKQLLYFSTRTDNIKKVSNGFKIEYPFDLEGEFTLVVPKIRTLLAKGILIINRFVEETTINEVLDAQE